MGYQFVIYEKQDNIARITLNLPEKLNAWDFPGQGGLTDDFYSALTEAEDDDEVKVVIINGAGRAFSAGHDLNTVGFVYGMGTGKPGERRASQRAKLRVDRKWYWVNHQKLFYCPKVTITQVHGYCVGEGLLMVEECDLAIAAEDAQLGHTEQRLGFAGSGISTLIHLILAVGMKRARELMLTGRLISGKEAAEIGLVNKAVPADKLEEEVNKLAETICLLPADGIAIGKAFTHLAYETLGLTSSFTQGYIGHTLFTNLRWEPGEYNFFKQRRNKGVRAGIHERDDRYVGPV